MGHFEEPGIESCVSLRILSSLEVHNNNSWCFFVWVICGIKIWDLFRIYQPIWWLNRFLTFWLSNIWWEFSWQMYWPHSDVTTYMMVNVKVSICPNNVYTWSGLGQSIWRNPFTIIWLVVWIIFGICPSIGFQIIPNDSYFSDGWLNHQPDQKVLIHINPY